MKISVITSRYGLSGVPLAQLRFSRALANKGYDVDYIVGFVNEGNVIPQIDNINILILNKQRVISLFIPLINYLKKVNPDVIFTAGDHLNVIVALAIKYAGVKTQISASCRVTPFDTYSNVLFSKRWILKQLMKLVMNRIDIHTCVSKDMVKQYNQIFRNPPHICVYNIVNDSLSQERMLETVEDPDFTQNDIPVIIAAGMLEPWKGFKDLILSIKEVEKEREVKVFILGDGSLKEELQSLIDELKLTSVIKLKGHVLNPLKYFKKSDIFVLSSYVEGLPNVLIEAMMCGCTPVSTNCPTGPSEVLQDGKYGYLVPLKKPREMAKAILEAIENPIRQDLLKEAIEPFSEELIINQHLKLLKEKRFKIEK